MSSAARFVLEFQATGDKDVVNKIREVGQAGSLRHPQHSKSWEMPVAISNRHYPQNSPILSRVFDVYSLLLIHSSKTTMNRLRL
jgi:hypothetical protein